MNLKSNINIDGTLNIGNTTGTPVNLLGISGSQVLSSGVVFDDLIYGSNNNYRLFCDFLTGTLTADNMSWVTLVSGTSAAAANIASEAGRMGIMRLTTGTTATGRSGGSSGTDTICLGSGNFDIIASVRFPTLSNSTQRYSFSIGLHDSVTINATDGIYFQYDDATSANWIMITFNNGVSTKTPTSTVVTANQWYRLRISVNSGATSVSYYINNSLVGSISTNIPSGVSRLNQFKFMLLKSIGITSSSADIDYFSVYYQIITSR